MKIRPLLAGTAFLALLTMTGCGQGNNAANDAGNTAGNATDTVGNAAGNTVNATGNVMGNTANAIGNTLGGNTTGGATNNTP